MAHVLYYICIHVTNGKYNIFLPILFEMKLARNLYLISGLAALCLIHVYPF